MTVEDVSPIDLGERQAHFRKSYGGVIRQGMSHQEEANVVEVADIADEQARDEMLNEIHAMMYALCVHHKLIKAPCK